MSRSANDTLREFRHVFVKELRDVLRDRRAAFFTFVFPLLLYPLLFLAVQKAHDREANSERQTVRMGLFGDYDDVYRLLQVEDTLHVVLNVPPNVGLLEDGEFDALVAVERVAGQNAVRARVLFDGALPLSREAKRRVDRVLERYRMQLAARRLRAHGVGVPDAGLVAVSAHDIALEGERARALLARFLPAALLLLFFTGGAFAAMDLVAGEKERGTFETLFVQPVSPRRVAAAKFGVVMVCSLGSVAINLLGMGLAQKLQPTTGLLAALALPSLPTLGAIGATLVPLAVLTSGVLLAISSLARSFREAQTYLVPVMLVGLLPALLAAMPNVQLDLVTCWIPVGGVALAVRDAVAGELRWLPFSLAVASTALYSLAAVRWSAGLLTREELILGAPADPHSGEAGARRRSRRAIFFGAATLLLIYYGGTSLQAPDGPFGPYGGLALTLWVLTLGAAALFPVCCRVPLVDAWALRRPTLRDCLLALALVPAAALLVSGYMEVQNAFLPFPERLQEGLRELFAGRALPPLALVALFAVSPAVCEELLWRGAFQGEVEREGRPLKTVLLVGVFFGMFHLSVHRFVPTAVVGCLLAYVRLRTGSIVPSMLFHCAYNALVLLVISPLHEARAPELAVFLHPLSLAVAAGVLLLCARCLGRAEGTPPGPGARGGVPGARAGGE